MARNLTLGRGELYFARFIEGTTTPMGELYVGNTPEINLTIESEELEHFDSDHGINELDESIPLSTTRSGSFTTDDINPNNIANFFFGETDVFTVTGGAVADEPITGAEIGYEYQLGMSINNPSGARLISTTGIAVTGSGGTPTYVRDTDYEVDLELGRLTILAGGDLDGVTTDLLVDYTTLDSSRQRTISGSQPVAGAMRLKSFNPVGSKTDYYMPYVKLSPNGDFALKGDEWQTIPMNVKILKKEGYEALYMDGRAIEDV